MGALHYWSFRHGFSADPSRTARLRVLGVLSPWALVQRDRPGAFWAVTRWGTTSRAGITASMSSLPFFLPAPLPVLTGTLGAFIRIRERIPSKIALFDIGLSGPIAGFLVAVPALFMGLELSAIERGARGLQGRRARRTAALPDRVVAGLGQSAGRHVDQHAPDGVRVVVRPAGDRAEPVSDRTARWRTRRPTRSSGGARASSRSARSSRRSA